METTSFNAGPIKSVLFNKNGINIGEVVVEQDSPTNVSLSTTFTDKNANVTFEITTDESNWPGANTYNIVRPVSDLTWASGGDVVKYDPSGPMYFWINNYGYPSTYVTMIVNNGVEFTAKEINTILANMFVLTYDDIFGDGSQYIKSLYTWPSTGPAYSVLINRSNFELEADSLELISTTDGTTKFELYGEDGMSVGTIIMSSENIIPEDATLICSDDMDEHGSYYYDTFVNDDGVTMYNYYKQRGCSNNWYESVYIMVTTHKALYGRDEDYGDYPIKQYINNICIFTIIPTQDEIYEPIAGCMYPPKGPINELIFNYEIQAVMNDFNQVTTSDYDYTRISFIETNGTKGYFAVYDHTGEQSGAAPLGTTSTGIDVTYEPNGETFIYYWKHDDSHECSLIISEKTIEEIEYIISNIRFTLNTNYNEYKVNINTSDFLVRATFKQDCKITSEPESESTGYGLTDIYFYSDLVQGCRLQYSIFDAMPEEMNDTDNITDLGSLGNSGLQVYQYTVIPETSYAYIYQHSGTGAWIRITDTTGIEDTFVDAISVFIDNVSLA